MISSIEIVFRLLISAIMGGLIGIEREANNRPAGLRTHVLVTIGSTLIMLISIDGFDFLGPDRMGDPARLAAQVVSGIGFLGAGTIMRTGNSISGLTTAASLWVCAGIGLGVGAGYYLGSIITGVIVLLTLMTLRHFERKLIRRKYTTVEVLAVNRPRIIGEIGVVFGNHNISIKDIRILNDGPRDEEGENKLMEINFVVKLPSSYDTYNLYRELYDISGIIDIRHKGERIRADNKTNIDDYLKNNDDY